jgi:membrane protease YdiL (CAAX protease family)
MWEKLPVWFRAIVSGLIVTGVPTLTWGLLAAVNLRFTPRVPWSGPAMAALLWLYWRYLSTRRKDQLRAKSLAPRVWRLALLGAGSAVAAVWASFAALRDVLHIAPQASDLAHFPVWTILPLIVIGSAVAGVTEEAGFRGAMQVLLERAYGPVAAIAITSILFVLVHLTHGAAVLPFLPFYFVVAVVYGLLAYLTGSILPSMVLHFAGDVLMFALRYAAVRFGAAPIASTPHISPGLVITALAFATAGVVICRLLARETHIVGAAA